MIRRGVVALAIVALLAALFAAVRRYGVHSQARAAALLEWAEVSEHVVPHTGRVVTTTFLGPSAISSEVRVTRTGPGSSRIDYLSPPLAGVYAIEQGNRVWRYDPSRHVIFADQQLPAHNLHPGQHIALLLRNYRPLLVGRARVAGRSALRLELDHRRTRQRARLFWIDAVKGLILRREEYRHDGTLSTRTLYREIEFPPTVPAPPHLALPPVPVIRRAPAPLSVKLLAAVIWPRYVPPGYKYEGALRSRCGCACATPVAHLRYFDGLRTISVFRCPHCDTSGGGCDSVPLPHGNLIRVAHRGATIFVIGEAEPRELRRMAESVR